MSDTLLMQSVYAAWHDQISAATKDTPVPAELLAAIIANESGGKEQASRFEPNTFRKLCEVLAGKRQVFDAAGIKRKLSPADLLPFVSADWTGVDSTPAAGKFLQRSLGQVAELATSYGLTQIMGWHWLEFEKLRSRAVGVELPFAVELLVYFAGLYGLNLSSDYEKIFRCWNTGRPDGQTFDPEYVPNGLHRLTLYALAGQPAGQGTANA